MRGDVGLDFGVEANLFVHLLLDVGQFGGIDGGEMRKIEAQPVRRDQRAGLLDVRAQDVAQRGVHQVRRRVIALVALAARGVGFAGDAIAHAQRFLRQHAVRDQARDGIVRAAHFGQFQRAFVIPERAGVGDLPAGFGIERRAVEHDFAFGAGGQFVDAGRFGVTMASMRQSRALVP